METVFVYGTLRRGEGNHPHYLGRAEFAGAGRTVERMTLCDLGAFPAAIRGGGPAAVAGELYRVDAAMLARLDRLEGVPHLYQREQVEVETDAGEIVEAWMYVLRPDGRRIADVIVSGDWTQRARRRASLN